MKEPIIETTDEAKKLKMYIFQKKHDLYVGREHLFEKNIKRIYIILLGQCTPSLLTNFKSSDDWIKKNDEKDLDE